MYVTKRKKLISLCLMLAVLLTLAAHAYAYVPTQRFTFVPIAYEGDILDALPCSEGLFAVKDEKFKSGFINTNGEVVIDFNFSDAASFCAGLAPASFDGGKYGFIGTDGLFEIAPAFDSASAFSEGLSLVEKDARSFYIAKNGREIYLKNSASSTPITAFNSGVAWAMDDDAHFHLMDPQGKFINDTAYSRAAAFSDGVCWTETADATDTWSFGFQLIDAQGNTLIESGRYANVHTFSEGVCWAKRQSDNVLVLIDKTGKELFSVRDCEGFPTPYKNGISVGLENGLFTVWNTEGTVIFSSLSYRAVSYGGFSEGCLLVQDTRDGNYYIMQDTAYSAPQEEVSDYDFTYASVTPKNTQFEIVLKIDTPFALVNGEKTYIDADNPQVCSFTQNGRTLVPMRFLSENLPGWTITWDYLTESAILRSDTLSASFKTGMRGLSYIRFNADKKHYDTLTKTLDQPPEIANGRMFLPVRALSELMGVNVFYDERGLVVFSNQRDALSADDATQLFALFE